MAENMQIVIEGRNETGAAIGAIEGAIESLKSMVGEMTRSFSGFAEACGISFDGVAISAEGMIAPLATAGAEGEAALRGVGNAAEKTAVSTKLAGEATESGSKKGSGALGAFSAASERTSGFISKLKDTAFSAGLAMAGGFGLFEVAEKAIGAGDNVYKLSEKLHVTTKEAAELNKVFRVSDTDSKPFISTITRLDKAVEGAGKKGNATTKALAEFGLSLTDAHGKLLPMPEQLDRLAAAYQKSTDAGNEEAFSATVLGAKGQALIPMLADYKNAKEAASKVKGIGIDAEEAHKAEINLQAMKAQFGQLGLAASNALMPVAQQVLPQLMGAFQGMAQYISSHKEEINKTIQSIADVFKSLAKDATPILKEVGKAIEEAFSWMSQHGDATKNIVVGLVGAYAGLKATAGTINTISKAHDTYKKAVDGIASAKKDWNDIKDGISKARDAMSALSGGALSAIKSGFTSFASLIKNSTIVTKAQAAAQWLLNAAMDANPIGIIIVAIAALVAGLIYAYSHSEKFREVVDKGFKAVSNAISTAVSFIVNFVKQHWDLLLTIILGPFGFILAQVIKHWSDIRQAFNNALNSISNFVSGIFNGIGNTISSFGSNAYNFIVGGFNTVVSFFESLPSKALQWGVNMINGFTSGIKNMIGSVGDAVSGIADKVKSFLGFHSPTKEGPGSESGEWAPNFVKMFSGGIFEGADQVSKAAGRLIAPIKTAMASAVSGIPMNASLSQTVSHSMTPAIAGAGGGGNNVTIIVNASGNIARNERELADLISRGITAKMKLQGKF